MEPEKIPTFRKRKNIDPDDKPPIFLGFQPLVNSRVNIEFLSNNSVAKAAKAPACGLPVPPLGPLWNNWSAESTCLDLFCFQQQNSPVFLCPMIGGKNSQICWEMLIFLFQHNFRLFVSHDDSMIFWVGKQLEWENSCSGQGVEAWWHFWWMLFQHQNSPDFLCPMKIGENWWNRKLRKLVENTKLGREKFSG